MVALVLDSDLERRIRRHRRRTGIDRFDEVWEGVYVMSPAPDPQHQGLGGKLSSVFDDVIDVEGLDASYPGVNVSDRKKGWRRNYRIPDVAVFLNGTRAVCRGAVWVGDPDFGVEIGSENDRSWEKLPFYAKVKTRELLLIDRDPWRLSLLRLVETGFAEAGRSTIESPHVLRSEVVPLSFWLAQDDAGQVRIEMEHHDGLRRWSITAAEDRAILRRFIRD